MFRISSHRFLVLALFATLSLSGCGGGGGGGGGVSASPEGFWSGTATSGYTVNLVVLEDGETWGIYSSGTTIYGGLYGVTSVSGSTATATGTDFNFLTNRAVQGVLSGPITARSSMSLSGSTGSVQLAYSSAYEAQALQQSATGTWSFVGRSGLYSLIPGSVSIDASGSFTLNQTNCTTTGSITPRPSGKNVFNINLSATGVGCAVGQSNLSGVAYLDTSVTPNTVVAISLTPARDDGLIVLLTKQ
jgi:hypothetical protein